MIPIAKDDLVILMEGGYLYLRMGRFQEAREVFEGVSVLVPESDVPLVALGSVYFGQMKYDLAMKCYRKALAVKSDSAFARAYLGESLFFKGLREESLVELQKASDLEPHGKSGDFARTLLDAIQKGFNPPGMVVKH